LLLTQDIASEEAAAAAERESSRAPPDLNPSIVPAADLATPLCPQHEHHRLRLLLGVARAAAMKELRSLKVASLRRCQIQYEALVVADKKIDHALLFAAMSEAESEAFLEAEFAQVEVDEAQTIEEEALTDPQQEALDIRIATIDDYLLLTDAELVASKQEIEAFLQVSLHTHARPAGARRR
jgi:hypothetical protein